MFSLHCGTERWVVVLWTMNEKACFTEICFFNRSGEGLLFLLFVISPLIVGGHCNAIRNALLSFWGLSFWRSVKIGYWNSPFVYLHLYIHAPKLTRLRFCLPAMSAALVLMFSFGTYTLFQTRVAFAAAVDVDVVIAS